MDLPFVLVLLFGATTLALELASTLRGRRNRRAKAAAAATAVPGVPVPGELMPVRGSVAAPPAHVVHPAMASYVDPAAATMKRPADTVSAAPEPGETPEQLAERWAWVDEVRWADPDGTTFAGVSSLSGTRD